MIDTRPLIAAVVADVRRGVPGAVIARRFHSTLVEVIAAVCGRLRDGDRADAVVLSGGVFLNAILLAESRRAAGSRRVPVYRHRLVPPNDGGLCLGQLAVAAAAARCDDPPASPPMSTSPHVPRHPRQGRRDLPRARRPHGQGRFRRRLKRVCLEHVPEIAVGEYVLVHVGFALSPIDEAEAARVFALLAEAGELDEVRRGDR